LTAPPEAQATGASSHSGEGARFVPHAGQGARAVFGRPGNHGRIGSPSPRGRRPHWATSPGQAPLPRPKQSSIRRTRGCQAAAAPSWRRARVHSAARARAVCTPVSGCERERAARSARRARYSSASFDHPRPLRQPCTPLETRLSGRCQPGHGGHADRPRSSGGMSEVGTSCGIARPKQPAAGALTSAVWQK